MKYIIQLALMAAGTLVSLCAWYVIYQALATFITNDLLLVFGSLAPALVIGWLLEAFLFSRFIKNSK